jgi:hypothetical protein
VKTALVRPLPTLPPFVSSDEDGRLLTTAMLTLDETAFISGGILKRNRERLRSKHGEWLPWLKKHFGRSETTARRYMFYYDTCMTADPPRLLPYRDDEDEEPKPSTVEDLDQAITNVEFYTPAVFVEAARKVLGEIDLDPGSNPEANEKVVRAKKIYTKDNDGLAPHNEWHGRVFCNPPYQGLTGKFARKLLAEYEAGRTTAAIFLVTNQGTRTRWFPGSRRGTLRLPSVGASPVVGTRRARRRRSVGERFHLPRRRRRRRARRLHQRVRPLRRRGVAAGLARIAVPSVPRILRLPFGSAARDSCWDVLERGSSGGVAASGAESRPFRSP